MDKVPKSFFEDAHWIGEYIRKRGWAHSPVFRKRFSVETFTEARCAICGLGFFELRLNGRKVGDDLLTPTFTRYDLRSEYFCYDVAEYLTAGENVAEVILGNGFYNQITPDVFRSERAVWGSDPKFILDLRLDGRSILTSDASWLVAHGPILSNSVRTGEKYDARLELAPWLPGETPDPAVWRRVYLTDSPGGTLSLSHAPACRAVRTLEPVAQWRCGDGTTLFDFGENIAGNCKITVSGPAGSEAVLVHGEKLDNRNDLDNKHIAMYTFDPGFQTDRYILNDRPRQTWSPRFSWHGFRYVKVSLSGGARLDRIAARVIRSGFAAVGHAACSDAVLNALTRCALRSYEANFVNFPTDCPHREKMGWTGDAQLAAELGLWHCDAGENYRAWLAGMRDCQRLSGQIPGIVPFCAHWQFGPVWDSALILLPYQVWRFTGDEEIVRENYGAGKKLLDFWASLAPDGLIEFGPGDWCHAEQDRAISGKVDASAYYYRGLRTMALLAPVAGHAEDRPGLLETAERVRQAFQKEFCRPDGHCAQDEPTALALALEFDLAPAEERAAAAARLNRHMLQRGCRADFGIVGAKMVPRALAGNGYFDTALSVLTQPEFPGWGWWLRQGATSLWETWRGDQSRNHVMFGDLGAWLWEYACGLRIVDDRPGFRCFRVVPPRTARLTEASCRRETRYGSIVWRWRAAGGGFDAELTVPEGAAAWFCAPDGTEERILAAGTHRLHWH